MGETTWTTRGSATNVLSTELNSLAANALAVSASEYDNSSNLDLYAAFEITLASIDLSGATNPSVECWILDNVSAQEDGASVEPARAPDFIIPLREVNGAQVVTVRNIPIPGISFDVLQKNQNDNSIAYAASGNTLKIEAYGLTTA